MMTAIVAMQCRRDKINETAQQIVNLPGVSEVYSVSGHYDLVAIIRVKTPEDLSETVTSHLLKIGGIERTETMIAFKTYSDFDLEHMFTIGGA